MEERQITIDGFTEKIPDPFIVIATQNPIGSVGTNLLPDSQLDRFSIKLNIGYPKMQDEINILKQEKRQDIRNQLQTVITGAEIIEMQEQCDNIFVDDQIFSYIVRLLEATRTDERIRQGASTRAGISLLQMVKAQVFIANRDYITPADIKYLFVDVISHRIQLHHTKIGEIDTPYKICEEIINSIATPRMR